MIRFEQKSDMLCSSSLHSLEKLKNVNPKLKNDDTADIWKGHEDTCWDDAHTGIRLSIIAPYLHTGRFVFD